MLFGDIKCNYFAYFYVIALIVDLLVLFPCNFVFGVEIAGLFENTDRFLGLIDFASRGRGERPNNGDESAEKVINALPAKVFYVVFKN